ncbi:piggyBac transposable element-derived protein 4 [Atheta coriaria]|uniref:piggyBac transposable element-derived protein 4 n=1 Tax=Dalotia coriaria TaxID=877792 RepID=UPI0031F380C0
MFSSDEESSSDESSDITNVRNESRPLVLTSSSDEIDTDNIDEVDNRDTEWTPINEVQRCEIVCDDELLLHNVDCDDPIALYQLFVTDSVIEQMVLETNRYAIQCMEKDPHKNESRKHQSMWRPITSTDLYTFLGIVHIMGIVQLPEIRLYWSNNPMYANQCIQKQMPRDRFLDILKYLHFSDNTANISTNRLCKFSELMDKINTNFQAAVKPGTKVVINESIVPWRGRLSFKQYIPGKAHKYGVKHYKLCAPGGYTFKFEVYAGKNGENIKISHSHDVVMRLMRECLDANRILYTDSYYTSVPLAEELLQHSTYICGTIKPNRRFLPEDAKKKQKRGECYSAINHNYVKFVKWTDKRTICLLTTSPEHTCEIIESDNKRKPNAVFDYNTVKKRVDLSDQLASYYSSLGKTIKWYKKIVFQLICGTSVTNAWYIHQKFGTKKIDLLKFWESIIEKLLVEKTPVCRDVSKNRHFIDTLPGPSRKVRKRCVECYKNVSNAEGPAMARLKATKVTTFCPQCPNKPSFCINCFKTVHKNQ